MAQGALTFTELEARGIVERRKQVFAVTVDGEYTVHYAKDQQGKTWRWDPTKGRWRRTRKWPDEG